MKKYAELLSTGVPWISTIPAHWKYEKLGLHFSERNEKVSDKDYPPLSVTKTGIVPQLEKVAKTNDGDNRKLVKLGDFVINSRSDRRGSSGISNLDGSVSLINIVLKPIDVTGKWAHYLFRSHPFIEEYFRNGRGIVADLWTTRYSEMRNIQIPVPPLVEQDQIVRYLDWKFFENAKIIRSKQKEILDLKEYKKAIIFKLISQGINNTDMKPAPQWLGKIPAHWKYYRLKTQVKQSKETGSPSNQLYIGLENVKSWDCSYVNSIATADNDCKGFLKGDLLFGKLRPYLAKVFLPIAEGVCSSEFLVLRNFTGVVEYLKYVMSSQPFIMFVNSSTYGTKMPRASWSFIGNCLLPFPPLVEQRQIVNYLDRFCCDIDLLITSLEREIDLVNELLTKIVSDIVTGKVDVRNIVIPEYSESNEAIEIIRTDDFEVEDLENDSN